MKPVREWREVSKQRFDEDIVPLGEPAVLRGAAAHWPIVRETAPQGVCAYLKSLDNGRPQEILYGPPAIGGRFFYRDDMSGLNFERRKTSFPAALDDLLAVIGEAAPPAIYIESTPIAERIPRFTERHTIDFPPPSAGPRIWIGNAITVQTHFDLNDNIAVVAAGRRRFTLFPPDQIGNLYVGPLDFTLSGPPVSMVNLNTPDRERHPRFAAAEAAGLSAELEPGDAIYIPYGWWHQVQSLTPFNVLVNYWWNADKPKHGAPFDALLHAVMAIRDLPENQRAVWRNLFDQFAFKQNGEPFAHLGPDQRGIMGDIDAERARTIKAIIVRALSR